MNISPEPQNSKPKFSIWVIIGVLLIACGGFLLAFFALHLFYVRRFPSAPAIAGFVALCGAIFFATFGSIYFFLMPTLRKSAHRAALIVSSESRHVLALSNILADYGFSITTTPPAQAKSILRSTPFDFVFISPADAKDLRIHRGTRIILCARKSETSETSLYSHGRMNDVLTKPVSPGTVAEIMGRYGLEQARLTGD